MASTHDAKLVSESVNAAKQRPNARVRSYDISSNKFTEVEQIEDHKVSKSKKTSPHRLQVEQPAFITNPIAECSKLSVALSSTADAHDLMSQRDFSTYLST